MNERYPRLRYPAWHGGLSIREGVRMCLYVNRRHEEIASAVAQSLKTYLTAVGPELLAWFPDDTGDWWELDDSTRDSLFLQLKNEREPGGCLFSWYESPSSARGYEVEYCGKQSEHPNRNAVCALSFSLPTEYLEEKGPEQVHALMCKLAAPLPFCSGHAGLAFNYVGNPRELSIIRMRYPGMDDTDLMHVSWNIGTRIRGPSWINFLGEPMLGELGGLSGLNSRLSSKEATVQDMHGGRAVVTLGAWPEAGDTEQGRDLPLYREWARLVEPWLYQESRVQGSLDGEDTLRWERRFLDK